MCRYEWISPQTFPNPNLELWIQHPAIEIFFFYWSSHFWCHTPCHSQHYPIYTTNRCNGYGSKKDLKMEVWYSKMTKLGGTQNDPWSLQSSHSSGSPELGKSQRTASASPVQHWQGSAMDQIFRNLLVLGVICFTIQQNYRIQQKFIYKLDICVHYPIAKQCLNSLISMTRYFYSRYSAFVFAG